MKEIKLEKNTKEYRDDNDPLLFMSSGCAVEIPDFARRIPFVFKVWVFPF